MKMCFLFIWRLHWVRKGSEEEAVDSFFLFLFSIFSSHAAQKKTGCMGGVKIWAERE